MGLERRRTGATEYPANSDFVVDGLLTVWRRRYRVIWVSLVCAAIAFIASFLMTPHYTATVSILPDTDGPELGLFEQIGILSAVGASVETNIESLYGRILHSDAILDGILEGPWRWRGGTQETLFELYGLTEHGTEPTRRDKEELKRTFRSGGIAFSRDQKTGFMLLRVTVPHDPILAADLANELTHRLERFNLNAKRNKAAENRRFGEGRLAKADSTLLEAEAALTTFVANNRSYLESPQLLQQYRELARVVEAETAVWTELKRQYEIARIEENRGLVRIDVLDDAVPPLSASSPRRAMIAVAAFVAGAAFSIFVVLLLAARRDRSVAVAGDDEA